MSTSSDWMANARYDSPDPDHTAWLHEQDVKYGRVEPANEKERALRQGVLDQLGTAAADKHVQLGREAESGEAAPDSIRIGANTAEAFHVGDDAYTVEVALLDGRLAYYGGDGKHAYLTKEQAGELAGIVNSKGSIAPGEWLNGNGYPLDVTASVCRELDEERAIEDERSGIGYDGM